MKIIFLSQDGSIHRLIDALKGDIHLGQTEEEVLELLDEVDEDEECLLFLDYDGDQKKIENFNKSILENDWITRIIISGNMKVKDFKKHQKGKTAAHGYVLKPFTGDVFKSILNDLEISHLIEEQELYEEGQKLPEFPSSPQTVQGFESLSEETFEEDTSAGTSTNIEEFSASEFKMSTQVKKLVDLHSVKGDAPPFDGILNESIQAKFDEVFGAYVEEEESDFGSAENPGTGLSLREETQESIALDLNASEGDGEELDLAGDDGDEDIDLEAELNLGEDDGGEVDSEDALFESEEEIDLEAMDGAESPDEEIDLSTEDNELDLSEDDGGELDLSDDGTGELDLGADEDEGELDLSDDGTGELDLSADDESEEEEGALEFSGGDDELDLGDDLDFGEPSDDTADEVQLSGDLDDELTRLTEERSLPTKEELAEFDEDTGEIDISPNESNDEMQFDKPDNPTTESSIVEDDEDDFDLDDQLQASDSAEEEASEGMSMSDDDQNDELLEFEEEIEAEGELAFSTEPEADESESGDDSEEGGLDFNLGAVEEDDDELSMDSGDDESQAPSDDGGGFELDAGDDLGEMEVESGGSDSSGSMELGGDDTSGGLDLGGDDDDEFDLGTDAALSADEPDSDDSLESSDDDDDIEVPQAAPIEDPQPIQAAERSEFDDEELDFDDEDEELEKTQAMSMPDLSAVPSEDSDDELDFADDEDEELDGGLDASAESSDYDSDEELLNDDEFGEDTNPTVVMTEEATRDLENMVDNQVTNEFRPQGMEDNDTALLDDDDFDLDEDDAVEEVSFSEPEEPVVKQEPEVPAPRPSEKVDEGSLRITPSEERMPPRFNEGEAIRLQATIRQLREEREELLSEIQNLKKEKKVTESENLGLKAELDEAKIEISILKKRHSSEIDEMKYRLRITDEKKLYAEEKAKKLQKEFDRLQSKVRVDFNHIKQREKELESQLELVKMDTESQVQSRDKKILELKRKIDQLEFNMENVVIREQKSRDDKVRLEERLERIMKTLRGSIEVLEDDIEFDSETKRNRD